MWVVSVKNSPQEAHSKDEALTWQREAIEMREHVNMGRGTLPLPVASKKSRALILSKKVNHVEGVSR